MYREIRTTADGSSTLFVPSLDEHYHSVHGAVQESQHVFINAGLHAATQREITILEMGFGTGLNAWLTAIEAEKLDKTIHYVGIEKHPVLPAELATLNYTDYVKNEKSQDLFTQIHAAKWNSNREITPHFKLEKREESFSQLKENNRFNLIYFDAFAPSAQPDLWTIEMFSTLFTALKEGGILVTYCAKGQVKRNMKAAGFTIEALPGPPGKREMTRATKPKH